MFEAVEYLEKCVDILVCVGGCGGDRGMRVYIYRGTYKGGDVCMCNGVRRVREGMQERSDGMGGGGG